MNLDKILGITSEARALMPQEISFPGTFDPHVHTREEATGRMAMVVHECAKTHRAIMDIPNIAGGLQSGRAMRERRAQIKSHIPKGCGTEVFLSPLISDNTAPSMIREAWDRPQGEEDCHALKAFWQGVSNDYGNSISRADAIAPLLRSTTVGLRHKGRPIPITMHAECARDYDGNDIPIKDREWWCVQNEVSRIIAINPEGTYVIRHLSDYRTLEWVAEQRARGINIHAEVSPQYFILIDDDLFRDDKGHAVLLCNCIFWPRPKDIRSQRAIQQAVLAGHPWIHIGTDYAMHLDDMTRDSGVKINNRGEAAGGLNFLPRVAVSLFIDFFLGHGKPELLGSMFSGNAAALYGVTLPAEEHRYVRKDWVVDGHLTGFRASDPTQPAETIRAVNFLSGHTMHWQRATN